MSEFYVDPLVTLHLGNCLEVLPTLEADSVDADRETPARSPIVRPPGMFDEENAA